MKCQELWTYAMPRALEICNARSSRIMQCQEAKGKSGPEGLLMSYITVQCKEILALHCTVITVQCSARTYKTLQRQELYKRALPGAL